MAIPKVAPRTVLLKGKDRCEMKELPAGGAITPGHLVQMNSAGKWVVHPTAKGYAAPAFAVEADLIGKGIDDAYASNDNVYTFICAKGAEVNALLAANAAAIVIGDYLESAGDGTLRKLTAQSQSGTTPFAVTEGGKPVAQALEAVDNSAVGATARLKVVII